MKNTIYFIGGVSRSGKSTLRNLLLSKNGIEGMNLDILKTVIEKKHTDFYNQNFFDNNKIREQMWPYIESLAKYQYKFSKNGYVIEGDVLEPERIFSLTKSTAEQVNVKTIFLLLEEINIPDYIKFLRDREEEGTWTKKLTDDELIKHLNGVKENSTRLRYECNKFGIKTFEMHSKNVIMDAYKYLIQI